MRTRSIALTALLAVAGLVAACGDDDGSPARAAETADRGGGADAIVDDSSTDANADQAAGDGSPSDWYSDLDALEQPSSGKALLTLDGQTTELDVSYCEYSLNNMVVDEIPEQSDDAVFKLSVQLGGTLPDGRSVSIFAFRLVNPEHLGTDPYETDSVQFNANDGESTSVASRATARRSEAGGPVADGGSLPLLRIDGSSVTAIGEASAMGSAAGQEDMAVLGPFELAASCD